MMDLFYTRDSIVITGYDGSLSSAIDGDGMIWVFHCEDNQEQVIEIFESFLTGKIQGGTDGFVDALGVVTSGPVVVVFRRAGRIESYVGGVYWPGPLRLPLDHGPVQAYKFRKRSNHTRKFWGYKEYTAGTNLPNVLNSYAMGKHIKSMIHFNVLTTEVSHLEADGGIITLGLPDPYTRKGWPSTAEGYRVYHLTGDKLDKEGTLTLTDLFTKPWFDGYGVCNYLKQDEETNEFYIEIVENTMMATVGNGEVISGVVLARQAGDILLVNAYLTTHSDVGSDELNTLIDKLRETALGEIAEVWISPTINYLSRGDLSCNDHVAYTRYTVKNNDE